MNVTTTPAARSTVLVEVELPPERLQLAVEQAVRRLGRGNRIAGFRPGKAPRAVLERVLGPGSVLEDAVDHLVQDAYRQALAEKSILPLAKAEVEVVQAEEGKPLLFKATVPVRPEVRLGDYRNFPFKPEIEAPTDARVAEVVEDLREQYASLVAIEDRPAGKGDWAVVSFAGTKDGEPFEGGSAERAPLILGEERLIPGFEDHLIGLGVGESTEFDITFPDDYAEPALAGQLAHFSVQLRELRERVLPEPDDELARSLGDFADLEALRTDIRARLGRNSLDHARHAFADRIVDYAVANATLELPDVLVEQETEVIHDEFRASLARQGISQDAYFKATERTEADLHAEFRPRAETRVKTLLVLTRIAEVEGVEIPDGDVDAEVARARERYAANPRLVRYFESGRGRDFIRSTLRRSRVVERLIDEWLVAHPDHPALPHLEDDASPVDAESVASAASIGASDPGTVATDDPAAGPVAAGSGHHH